MTTRILAILSLLAALGGCSHLPYDVGYDEWQALTGPQKLELRKQWYAAQLRPPAAILSPAAAAPATPASADAQLALANHQLEQENVQLSNRLKLTEKRLAELEQHVHAAADSLAQAEPPAPSAAPRPAVATTPGEKP